MPMLKKYGLNFALICAGALLVSGTLGFVLGLMGGGVAVVPSVAIDNRQPSQTATTRQTDTTRTPDRTRDRETDNKQRPDSVQVTRPDPQPGPDVPDTGPGSDLPEAPARELRPGRTDPVERLESAARLPGEILVEVRNHRGDPMGLGGIALDVKAGPLDWQNTGARPLPVPQGERGVYRFADLQPGQYRVRSTATNYSSTEQQVTVMGGDSPRIVLVLNPAEPVQVDIVPRLPGGGSPDQVDVDIHAGAGADGNQGRFGEYAESTLPDRNVRVGRARYRAMLAEGRLRTSLPAGVPVRVTLTAWDDGRAYQGTVEFTPQPPQLTVEVPLTTTDAVEGDGRDIPVGSFELEVNITVAGMAQPRFTRVNLRRRVNEVSYRSPTRHDGSQFVWANLAGGQWYLVVEVQGLHAPFVHRLYVHGSGQQSVDIQTGRLRVAVQRETGSPDPPTGELRYGVRILPRGEGLLERVWRGDMTGKASDHIDFVIPAGEYTIQIEPPDDSAALHADPPTKPLTVSAGVNETLTFVLRAGSELKFRCVGTSGAAFPFAEYLISFHPAGSLPESEKELVRRTGTDGVAHIRNAPYGEVYLHIWTNSGEWHSPDKVFKLTLPAFGTKDLGAVVVAP